LIGGLITSQAVAQPARCTVQGVVSTPLRAEGLTEQTGDIIISCVGGFPTAAGVPLPTGDLMVLFNAPVTNRLYANGWSDALLIIDEPGNTAQLACADPNGICTVTGTGTGVGTYDGTAGRPNIFLGRVSGNSVTFPSVPFDSPGESGQRTLRITNIRVNATGFPPPPGTYPIQSAIIAGGLFAIHTAQPNVGYVQSSADFSLRLPDNSGVADSSGFAVSQCGAPQRVAVFRAAELFEAAFKKRTFLPAFVDSDTSPAPAVQNIVGAIYPAESGFYAPALSAPTVDFATVGLADAGTRVRAMIGNIPTGTKVFVGTQYVNIGSGTPTPVSADAVARLVQNEIAAFAPVAATGTLEGVPVAELPVVNGNATAVWEVLDTNPNTIENYDFPIWVQSGLTAGTAMLTGSYAPAPPAFDLAGSNIASATLPLPRFVSAAVPSPLFSTSACAVAASTSTTLTVTPSSAPSQYTLTATVTAPDPATYGQPSGSVTFYDGGSAIAGSATSLTAGGTASFAAGLVGGAHSLTAVFLPNNTQLFSPSTSPAVALTAPATATSTVLTAATSDAIQYGLIATVTAMVGLPAGSVTFYDGGTAIANSTTSLNGGGTAILNTRLVGGGHLLTAVFTPSNTQVFAAGTSPTLTLTVPATPTSTALTATPTGATNQYSLATIVAAIVGAPAGSVTFYDNGAAIPGSTTNLTSGGIATFNAILLGGGHTLTAVFTPSDTQRFTTSTSPGVSLTVPAAATSTVLAATPTGATNQYSLTATVTTPAPAITGAPAGTVTFYDNGSAIAGSTTTLTSGRTATFAAVFAIGGHTLTAVFTPSNSQLFSSSTSLAVSFSIIGRANASMEIASNLNPSLPGQAVTFTATVTGGVSTPTGTVQFADGSQALGSAALAGGRASVTAVLATPGVHNILATYGGDAGDTDASARFGQSVDRVTDSLTLASSTAAANFGQTVTMAATLSPVPPTGVPAATGTVQFQEGATVIGSAALASGAAALAVSNLTAGTHQIVAIYSGDGNWYGTHSSTVTVNVNLNATTAVLTSSATMTEVQLSATLTPAAGGSIYFLDSIGNITLGTAQLVNGTATLALTPADAAKIAGHPIMAVYSGSAGFARCASNTLVLPALGNAAGGPSVEVAPEELVSIYGSNLAVEIAQPATAATALTLPQSLGGLSVSVADGTGAVLACGLSYVSPSQVNFLMPPGLAPGAALVTVVRAGTVVAAAPMTIARVAPGIFAASQLVHADNGAVYLVFYGTGIRNRSDSSAVTCMVNGTALPVAYAGAQPDFPGLDQVNVLLPAAVRATSTLSVSLLVDGQSSNTVIIPMQ
jgi:uncharacterized protein (TIGR03437 family)